VLAKVANRDGEGELPLDEGTCRIRNQDLPPMGCRGDAGGAMDIETDVVVAASLCITRVQSHPHKNFHSGGPVGSCKGSLGLDDGSHRLPCMGEDNQERIALRAEFDPIVGREGGTHESLMRLEHVSVRWPQILKETRRTFDVGEEKEDCPGWQLRHGCPRCYATPSACNDTQDGEGSANFSTPIPVWRSKQGSRS
jgi:hypothetical protein